MLSLAIALRENLPRRKRLAFLPRGLPRRYDFALALKAADRKTQWRIQASHTGDARSATRDNCEIVSGHSIFSRDGCDGGLVKVHAVVSFISSPSGLACVQQLFVYRSSRGIH